MCRLVGYLGTEILLETVLVNPENSLLKQSIQARESDVPTNGDGFGVGWYAPKISDLPGLFTSICPAWSDRNLLNLTAKIESPCFFAHIRSASAGGVTIYNCHPFVHGKWMLMHNGGIDSFILVKRHLRHLLEDDIYHWIQGETDSEHLFALFLQMAKGRDLTQLNNVAELMKDVFSCIHELTMQYGTRGNNFFNVCITDGKRMIASRYCSDRRYKPLSLHYSKGHRFIVDQGHYHMSSGGGGKPQSILIASEILNDFANEWIAVPEHHILMVDSDLEVDLCPV